MFKKNVIGLLVVAASVCPLGATADMVAAEKWLPEFQPSTLSKEQQLKELQWFVDAAAPYKGMEIKVVSENIKTHEYESQTLAKAFSEVTGIKVTHTDW